MIKIPIITQIIKNIEYEDSKYWLNYCEKELLKYYTQYNEAVQRFEKAKKAVNSK